MIDRDKFFGSIRQHPFGGHLTDPQVAGTNAILDTWEYRGDADWRWLAYMLATAYHETAHTMQPIEEEGRGRGHKYGIPVNGHAYYGRGYVQLTWDYNYKKMGGLIGVDLIASPERALDPEVAALIMFEGMERGSFTGKKLSDYFDDDTTDWVNARRIINGTDRARLIAAYATDFHDALTAAT